MITDTMSFRVASEEFRKRDFGMTRLETARKLLDDYLHISVEGIESMQVIPLGEVCEIRLRSK